MSDSDAKTPIFGIIAVITTLVFVVLKVVGAISWPWFWVLSPFIAYGALCLLGLLVGLLLLGVAASVAYFASKED